MVIEAKGRATINKSLFRINQRVEISLTKDMVEFYHSRIEEITDEYILIAMPMSKGYPVQLAKGRVFYGKVIDNTSVYQFTSHIVDKKAFPLPLWVIAKPRDLKKIQLRSFVRIEARIRIEMRILLENDDFEIIDATSKDISGGGVLVVSKQVMYPGSKLKLSIAIPTCDIIYCKGQVVRVDEPQGARVAYLAAIRFTDIAESDRNKIIRYIFKEQLERRQRGF